MSAPLFHMIPGAPEPVAPFSHAVEQDGWVFVTGQLPFTGLTNDSPYPEGIEAQTRLCRALPAAAPPGTDVRWRDGAGARRADRDRPDRAATVMPW